MQVRQFYTAPTLIRALEAAGDKFVTKSDLSSLRILGTVGEPINAKAWNWYHKVSYLHNQLFTQSGRIHKCSGWELVAQGELVMRLDQAQPCSDREVVCHHAS